jgi:hypothetical protein
VSAGDAVRAWVVDVVLDDAFGAAIGRVVDAGDAR